MELKKTSQGSTTFWSDYYKKQANVCQDASLQRFYKTGLVQPQTPISEVPLMAMDFETTGLNPDKHDILSIGMVPFSLSRIQPSKGHYWVVNPRRSLHEESIAFHRITHSEIEHAPDLETVLDEMLERMAGHLVVVHYRNIERAFLDGAIFARRGEHCLFPVIDTMSIEARFERNQPFQRLKRFFGISPPSIRLADSRNRYGLPMYSSHHAKVDALSTAELLQAQIARHYTPQTPVSELWT